MRLITETEYTRILNIRPFTVLAMLISQADKRGVTVLSAACLLGLVGCSMHPPRAKAPSWNPEAMAKAAVEQFDKSGDGLMDKKELRAAPGLADAFQVLDTDQDGLVSEEELTARLQLYEDLKTAFVRTSVEVRLDGRPLQNAFVKLVPEEFQGDSLVVASGQTNSIGRVAPRSEGKSIPAMQPGFYRVDLYRDEAASQPIVVKQQLGLESSPQSRPGRMDVVVLNFKSA